ncbi:MAG: FAD-dependent oxidoreductase [Chloroflexi bacterium]|nr:FAD-dependent oxidoreductase [Chloroflexota bacterium]
MKQVDVAVIGGGPAGIAAAIELAKGDVSFVVIDSYPQPGGHYFRQSPNEFGTPNEFGALNEFSSLKVNGRQAEYQSLMAEAAEVEILSGTTVWSMFRDEETALFTLHLQGHAIRSVQATTLLLAPGSYDRPLPFPGWQLPGVMTLGGAQMLIKGHGILPGKRILVAGGGPLLLAVAAGLIEAGADVEAVLDTASMMDGVGKMPSAFWGQWGRLKEAWQYASTIRRSHVPILFGHSVFRAIGEEEVIGAAYGKLDAAGRPRKESEKIVNVDTICVSLGFLPNLALTRHLGCEHFYDPMLDSYYPQHDEKMETTVADIFVAGDVTGVGGKELSKLQGQIAGLNILSKMGKLTANEVQQRTQSLQPAIRSEKRFIQMMRDRMQVKPGLLDMLDDETVVCRCEMVTVGAVKTAVSDGARDMRGAKLRTRAGMGACQSRYCEQTIRHLLAQETGQPHESVGTSSIRPPLIPVMLKDILQ